MSSSENLFAALKTSMTNELVEIIRNELREGLKNSIREELKGEIKKNLQEDLKIEVIRGMRIELKDEVKKGLREELRDEVKKSLHEELKNEVRRRLQDELMEDVRESLRNELKEDIRQSLREELKEEPKSRNRTASKDVSTLSAKEALNSSMSGAALANKTKGLSLAIPEETMEPANVSPTHGSKTPLSAAASESIDKFNRLLDSLFTENPLERTLELSDMLSNVLKKFSSDRELRYEQGGSCVNDVTFKGMVLSYLSTAMEITGRNVGIWSEREVIFEDGRKDYIDLLLKCEDHFVVIQLDYISEAFITKSDDGLTTMFQRPEVVDGETRTVTLEKVLWMNKLMKTQAEAYARGLRSLLLKKAKKPFKFTCVVLCGFGTEVAAKISVSVNKASGGRSPSGSTTPSITAKGNFPFTP